MYWRGSRGLEMIPNLGFWKELPGHVKVIVQVLVIRIYLCTLYVK